MTTSAAITQLAELASRGASGELICVTASCEVHVYLQNGRIAWATDSQHPFAFATHLREAANIDAETFRGVVEECRRDRLPLGETLVNWGLASWDVVRSSLGQQVGQAIRLIAANHCGQALFLERAYAKYNPQLTFAVDEFVATPVADSAVVAAESAPVERLHRPSDRPGAAGQLRQTIEGLHWVETLDGERCLDADPPTEVSRVPPAVRDALSDGADFVAVRTSQGSLVGLSGRRPGRALWCRLDADSTFGATVSALWAVASAADRTSQTGAPRQSLREWPHRGADAAIADEVTGFMDRAQDALAVLLLSADAQQLPAYARGSQNLDAELCIGLARRRLPCLRQWDPMPVGGNSSAGSLGFDLRAVVTGEPRLWCFGAELGARDGETLWLFTDRRGSQGLGWAYLSALSRALCRGGGGSAQ